MRERRHHDDDAACQGHRAQDGLSGVHRRRRLRPWPRCRAPAISSWSPTRRPSACCPGRRTPAGCCATSISRTASRCRSRRAQLFRDALGSLRNAGFDFLAGLEVEFHLFKLEDPRLAPDDATWPPRRPTVSCTTQGYQYLTESRFDQVDPLLERSCADRAGARHAAASRSKSSSARASANSPSARRRGLAAADTMMLFRSAVKQIARRHGYLVELHVPAAIAQHASPAAGICTSRCSSANRASNAFVSQRQDELLSPPGRHYLGGLLAHARAAAAFTTPTVNGYKRYHGATRWRRSGDLGARQSRRDGARARRARRSVDASGKSRRRAARQSVSLHGLADPRRPRRHRAQARSRPVGRHALRDFGRAAAEEARRGARRAATTAPVSAQASATPSSTITSASSRPSRALRGGVERTGRRCADVTAWEHKEYFDLA